MKYLWRHNAITGLWDQVRDIAPGNEAAWLAVWQRDEPGSTFRVAKRRPKPLIRI